MISKKSLVLFLITLFTSTSICAQTEVTEETDGVTYDVVTITVKTSKSDAQPVFARVKYNKLCPLSITSDDMGRGEFVRNWSFFNGYPVFHKDFFGQLDDPMTLFEAPYNTTTLSWQEPDMTATSWQPLTYSDGTGGVRRFTATSAIMPYKIANTNYSFINPDMAKAMVRTGWSFAQHDVADEWPSDVSTDEQQQAYIKEQLPLQSNIIKEVTGYGLKVLVEPNGNKNYIKASLNTNDICWNIFQNATTDYPGLSKSIDDWTNREQTTFNNKPTGAYERIFFQELANNGANDGKKLMDVVNPIIANKDDSNMILGGTHTIGNRVLNYIKNTVQPTDLFWVAGADEVWEYYHLYHNAKIENIHHDGTNLTFDVKIPRYEKSQFREMTINIPGVTDANGTDCTFSNNVVTGGAANDTEGGRFVINFGIETSTKTYISQLLPLYRCHLHNEYLKRDIQYLIDLLVPSDDKTNYQSQLDAEATYSYTVKNSFGTVLTSGASDVASEVNYKYPKYILNEGTLYESAKNTNKIQGTNYIANYVGAFTPSGKDQEVTVGYTATQTANVTFYSEGEDLDGVTIATEDFSKIGNNSGIAYALRYASNGGAGEILSPVTATTLTPGKYTLVAAIGDTHTSSTAQFTFKVGGKSVLSLTTEDVSGYIKEYTKEGITVKTDQPLTIEAVNSGGSFWVDYLYLVKTGEYDATTPDVELTTETETVDMTDDSGKTVTITATSTAKGAASIVRTVIKDSNDQVVAASTAEAPTKCSYTFTPSQVGNVVFTAEATDNTENDGKTGLSDELAITVKSDFTLRAVSNMGDVIETTTFTGQTTDKAYKFLYPRYLLKGTDLYETAARSTSNSALHYGEDLTFTLANKTIERTVDYTAAAVNVVFYAEGEDIAGARTWTNSSFDKNQGQSYALTFGSMGACGALKSTSQGGCTITTLPAGQYKLTAVIGSTNAPATYSFKAGDTEIGTFTPTQSTDALSTYTIDSFTLTEETAITATSTQGTDNSQNWVDLVYIQKVDAVPVSVTAAGYATFSSPYALDFTSSTIKAYTATVSGNVVNMTRQTGTVPAATGLFLQGTEGTALNENIPLATAVPSAINDNALCAHLTTATVEAGSYVLSGTDDGGQMAFRKLTSDTEIPGGKAYLKIPGEASRTLLYVRVDDGVAGIQEPAANMLRESSYLYKLTGQKVGNNAKGIVVGKRKKTIKTK